MGPWCQPLSFLPLKQPILTIPVYPSRDSPYLYQQSASSSSETGINLIPSRQNLPTPQLTVQNSRKVSRLTHRCSKPFLSNAPWRVHHARTETNPTDHTENLSLTIRVFLGLGIQIQKDIEGHTHGHLWQTPLSTQWFTSMKRVTQASLSHILLSHQSSTPCS